MNHARRLHGKKVIQDGFSQLQDDNSILLYASDANVYAFFAFFSWEKNTLYQFLEALDGGFESKMAQFYTKKTSASVDSRDGQSLSVDFFQQKNN